jgi:ATP-binding cassette subfamily F protein 3
MIQLTGAAKRFGPKTLFENLDSPGHPNERAGIVGANGTGESTLLKILAGMDSLDAGSITVMKGASVGYLPQEELSLSGRTVFAECMTVFADLLALEQEQETLAHKLSELDPASPEYAQVADRFHRAEGEFLARDGFAIESKVGMVLSGLGFPRRQPKRLRTLEEIRAYILSLRNESEGLLHELVGGTAR